MTEIEREIQSAVKWHYSFNSKNTQVRWLNNACFVSVHDDVIYIEKGGKSVYAGRGTSRLVDSRLKILGATDETPMHKQSVLQTLYKKEIYGLPRTAFSVKIPNGKTRYFATRNGAEKFAEPRGYFVETLF